jgi:ABC-2 type transport system ATP-binding protein
VREVAGRGTTVLLTTQYLDEADQLAARISVMDAGRVIAEGTPDELKRAIGGDRIVATPSDAEQLRRTAEVLGESMGVPAVADRDSGKVTVTAPAGLASLSLALTSLEAARVELADLELRRPTLDDAFLALTDRSKENA